MEKILKKLSQWKLISIIYCLIMAIIGVIALYLSYFFTKNPLYQGVFNSLGATLITAAFFTIIINIFQKNHFEDKLTDILENKLPFIDRVYKIGLTKYEDRFPLNSIEYEKYFIDSEKVDLVFNDGIRFYDNNIELFRKRFKKSKKETNFILMDPESMDSMSVLTRKNNHKKEPDYYKIKISRFIDRLKEEIKTYPEHTVNIYVHDLFNTMSIILLDNYTMISLYRISPGKDTVPHIVFEKNGIQGSEYNKIYNDVKKLKKLSKLMYNSCISIH
ncbi:hypothetical protein AAFL35_13520 [Proteus mirabilis]|uniref:hypothetical protein n=1 Tax=Proteus mirabilis TaxID=584 RepID=UPI0018C7582B|nr:hypothetical protein [Proteus mirabilis]HEK3116769.1 hypothetical protein [Proteus mirabilis]